MHDVRPEIEERIKSDSAVVDEQFVNMTNEAAYSYSLSLPVPPQHPRSKATTETKFTIGTLADEALPLPSYYLVDSTLRDTFMAGLGDEVHFVKSAEDTLKEISWLNSFIDDEIPEPAVPIVGIGGGVLLNAAAYIAERQGTDFISVPTTVLAAADSAIGGLVRINKVDGEQFQKSFYKSIYEPSRIIVDPKFLATLPKEQISFGLSEVIKHGVYQSPALLEYLASGDFDPLHNQAGLLKAICWTVALKNVAIIHDPDSESFGGDILRGGHKLALAIEEEFHFRVSHGQAVAIGVYQSAAQDSAKIALLDKIYQKLSLPKTQGDLRT